MSNSNSTPLTSGSLAALPTSYFQSVDAHDLDRLLAHFAPHATFTIQTDQVTVTGTTEIRNLFASFLNRSRRMHHQILNTVVDEASRKVCTEQRYTGEFADGVVYDMHNCNFFEVDTDGRIVRVVVWMAGGSPLKPTEGEGREIER